MTGTTLLADFIRHHSIKCQFVCTVGALSVFLIGITSFSPVLAASAAPGRTMDITFFEHEHLRGKAYKVTISPGDCINLRDGRSFSSARFSDLKQCIAVFNADNCKQRRVIFKNGTVRGVDRFADVGGNDDIASVRFCTGEELN